MEISCIALDSDKKQQPLIKYTTRTCASSALKWLFNASSCIEMRILQSFFCLLRFPGYLQELHSNDWKQIDQTQQHFKTQTCMRQTVGYILGLQPREKAAMLGVNTREFFWNMKREFSFQRREMLWFLSTTMTAVIDVTCKPSIGKCSHSIFLIVT